MNPRLAHWPMRSPETPANWPASRARYQPRGDLFIVFTCAVYTTRPFQGIRTLGALTRARNWMTGLMEQTAAEQEFERVTCEGKGSQPMFRLVRQA
jgi:hypothetical protein